jgi:mono/diheme cytochrome c family protein
MNTFITHPLVLVARLLTATLLALLLVACGDDSDTQTKPDLSFDIDPAAYSGPPPATDDVNAYKQFLWNNVAVANRCGSCHGSGGQSPQFVRSDDINLAYAATNPYVDLANPEDSILVERVASGHNCWSDDLDVCETVMTTYIRNWALATVGGPAASVTLTAPPEFTPGATKRFPASPSLFEVTVYPVLEEYCASCHSPAAGTPQAPFFAAADVAAAYAAARNSINLNEPSRSRFVQRLRDESHNCWDGDCAASAAEIQEAIRLMAVGIPVAALPDGTVASRALGLRQGIVATSGGRHETNVIAKYEFKEGAGSVVRDNSGVAPSLDLNLSGATEWVGGWGMRFDGGKAQGSTLASRKLQQLLSASGEYSIEAWVAPANVTQEGPARIVSYSGSEERRNFMLGQSMYNYDFHNRNGVTDADGVPALSTADADQRLQATLQHVVVTYTTAGGRRIYVNGEYTGDADPSGGGTLNEWDNSYALVLGSEVDGSNPFRGVIRMVAIHSRALTSEQIEQNFDVGVGEKFFLLFGIGHLVDATEPPPLYVLFEGSQFDSYSYLFAAPRLVSLDRDYRPDIELAGMRIGINGHEAGFGQAFQPLDLRSNSSTWIPDVGDELSRIGTVIPLEDGPDFDQFFLTFEKLGEHEHVVTETTPPAPEPVAGEAQPDIGLRLFETVNESLAMITMIDSTDEGVSATYELVRQQLPASDQLAGFSSAQQIGITQLAVSYCDALVRDPLASTFIFPTFPFDAHFNSAFTAQNRSALIEPLLVRVANTTLLTMPDVTDMETELNALIDRLIGSCTGDCAAAPAERTKTIVKAVCTAAAGNAAMLLL